MSTSLAHINSPIGALFLSKLAAALNSDYLEKEAGGVPPRIINRMFQTARESRPLLSHLPPPPRGFRFTPPSNRAPARIRGAAPAPRAPSGVDVGSLEPVAGPVVRDIAPLPELPGAPARKGVLDHLAPVGPVPSVASPLEAPVTRRRPRRLMTRSDRRVREVQRSLEQAQLELGTQRADLGQVRQHLGALRGQRTQLKTELDAANQKVQAAVQELAKAKSRYEASLRATKAGFKGNLSKAKQRHFTEMQAAEARLNAEVATREQLASAHAEELSRLNAERDGLQGRFNELTSTHDRQGAELSRASRQNTNLENRLRNQNEDLVRARQKQVETEGRLTNLTAEYSGLSTQHAQRGEELAGARTRIAEVEQQHRDTLDQLNQANRAHATQVAELQAELDAGRITTQQALDEAARLTEEHRIATQGLQDDLGRLQSEHANLNNRFTAQGQELASSQQQVTQLTEAEQRLTEANAQLTEERDALNRTHQQALADLEAQRKKGRLDADTHSKEVAKLTKQHAQEVAKLEAKREGLATKLTGVRNQREAFREQVRRRDKKIQHLDSALTTANSEISGLKTQETTLNEQIVDLNQQLNTLGGERKRDRARLTATINQRQADLRQVQERLHRTRLDRRRLQDELATAQSELATARSERDTFLGERNAFMGERDTARSERDTLQSQLDAIAAATRTFTPTGTPITTGLATAPSAAPARYPMAPSVGGGGSMAPRGATAQSRVAPRVSIPYGTTPYAPGGYTAGFGAPAGSSGGGPLSLPMILAILGGGGLAAAGAASAFN